MRGSFDFERFGIFFGAGTCVRPPNEHPRMNEQAKNKAGGKPEADQITDGAFGESEGPGRLILVHAGYCMIPPRIATHRGVPRSVQCADPTSEADEVSNPFRKSDPDFFKAYFAARLVVNRAATQPGKRHGASGIADVASGTAPGRMVLKVRA